jgi:hypothetical protein
MTLDALIMLTGVLTVVLPYLGFPSAWDRPLYTFFGIIFIMCGITLRRRGHAVVVPPKSGEFVDSQPAPESAHSVDKEIQ